MARPLLQIEQEALESFRARVDGVLRRVRTAVGNVVVPLVGKRSVRSADLVHSLGIDNRLAWKLTKVMDLPDAVESARYLPGPRGVKLFLQAAAKRKAPADAVEEATQAFSCLQQLIDDEAGDRRSFDMMLAGQSEAALSDAGLEHRKAAFEHNGFIWGVQARIQLHTFVVRPSGDGKHLDLALVSGYVEMRRIRPQVPWRISRFYTIDDAGRIEASFDRRPIDPAGEMNGLPLLKEFCSLPLPDLQRTTGPQGVVDYRLTGQEVGNRTSFTCLTGEYFRHAEPCYPDERHHDLCVRAPLRTPCEAVVVDLMVDRAFFGTPHVSMRLLSDLFNDGLARQYTEADELPVHERVEALGRCEVVPPLRDFEGYRRMMQYVFGQVGWDSGAFDVYRAHLHYPPIPAAVMLSLPLPKPPGGGSSRTADPSPLGHVSPMSPFTGGMAG